jgi:hypothetical protein
VAARDSTCGASQGGKMPCFESICGRLGPKSCKGLVTSTPMSTLTFVSEGIAVSTITDSSSQASINQILAVEPRSKVPATLLTTEEEACAILSPYVRSDEDVHDLCMIYYPLLAPGFDGKMKEFLAYSANQPAEDGILFKWLEAGREWLGKYAAGHIANVSANVRSRLAEFEQKELDGGIVGTRTFVLRRGVPRLMCELDAALRFFYRYPSTLFDVYKKGALLDMTKKEMIESAIIPKILFTAAAEEPVDHGKLPVACLYCLSRGFTMKGGGLDLVMNECGWSASRISALLHLLRAGVCGYLVTLSGNTSHSLLTIQEMDIVGKIQNGRVTNLLAPYVKRLRDLNARKPPLKSNTVNANGDITSGGVTFPHSVWSKFIPRIVAVAMACFDEVFEDSQWKHFLEKSVNMIDWVQMEAFVIQDDNSRVRLGDIKVRGDVEPLTARLLSIAELCFFGFGVGAVRHEEVIRLTLLSCQWHNSYVYFWSESFKRGSMKASTTPKLVEHRLSLSISKVILLIRHAQTASAYFDPLKLLPSHPDVSMLGLVQDIFDLDCMPQMLNVRHLFTSIGNVTMPENNMLGDKGCFVSSAALTEKSGHTQLTGRLAYGTWLENNDECLYDRYHNSLGEVIMEPPVVEFVPFSEEILKNALKELLGRKANYRSVDQNRMIDIAANSVVRHAFVGLPCGHGKSLSWMVPTMASYLSGRHVGLRIVILPYKFLLGHIVHHATSLLGLLEEKLRVHFLDSSQIDKESCPDVLTGKDVPALIFLNLDGAALLIRFHLARLQALARQNILKRVYLDELQQLVVEYGFRSSYQCLRELGRIGIPIMCLSGSMPCEIAMYLMSYCGLTQSLENASVDIVNPTDPVGDGFSFDVVVVNDVATAIIDFVLTTRVGACHVLCSSLILVAAVTKELSKTLRVLSVTGNSSYQEQIRCSKSWLKGEYDVLVSTVVGLVGNENKFCKTIVVGGFLFNVSSLVQAIGRLRPTQRGAESKVQVFRFPFRSVDRVDASEKSSTLFSEMVEAGCLNELNKELFSRIYAPIGLQEVLSMKEGCYLQGLSACFGFARLQCNRCGLCLRSNSKCSSNSSLNRVSLSNVAGQHEEPHVPQRGCGALVNPYKKRTASIETDCDDTKRIRLKDRNDVLTSQQVAEETMKVSKLLRRKAKWVFGELLYRCLACGKADCNGEMCLNACFRCGNKFHNSNACCFNNGKLLKILPNKGVCFGCFDTRQHTMTKHDMLACPLKRRLKRLLFLDHERKGNSFEEYMRQLYSSELSFVSFVASYSHDTSLGRYVRIDASDAAYSVDCCILIQFVRKGVDCIEKGANCP